MEGRTIFPTFQGSRGTTVLEGLAQKDPNDSSCDALKEVFNDFGNEGTDQYDRFGDLRSEVAQQYIASNSLSSNANLLLSTTRQEDSASNIITQQLRELKGRHSNLYVFIYLPDSVILRWRTCSTWVFSTWICSTRICSTEQ